MSLLKTLGSSNPATPDPFSMESKLSNLMLHRQTLAYEASEGSAAARAALVDVEEQIAALQRDIERAPLIEVERKRRELVSVRARLSDVTRELKHDLDRHRQAFDRIDDEDWFAKALAGARYASLHAACKELPLGIVPNLERTSWWLGYPTDLKLQRGLRQRIRETMSSEPVPRWKALVTEAQTHIVALLAEGEKP